MTDKQKTNLKKAALKDVNKMRAILNLKPLIDLPKGKVKDGDSCPIANSFKDFTKDGSVEVDGESIVIEFLKEGIVGKIVLVCSHSIGKFVTAFDDKEFKELIK